MSDCATAAPPGEEGEEEEEGGGKDAGVVPDERVEMARVVSESRGEPGETKGERRDEDLSEAERLIAFTDAAVAIALTLLILPLMEAVPDYQGESVSKYFADNKQIFASFCLSFFVVSKLWVNHDRTYRYVGAFSPSLRKLNFLWLFLVVFIPVVTNLVAVVETDFKISSLYIGVMLLARLISALMVIVVRTDMRTWKGDFGPRWSLLADAIVDLIMFAFALLLSLAFPKIGYFSLLLLLATPLILRVLARKWPKLEDD